MNRDKEPNENREAEGTIRDGNVIIDERMNRRDGLVEYVGEEGETADRDRRLNVADVNATPAMQAGATVLGGVEPAERVAAERPTVRERSSDAPESLSMSTDNTAGSSGPILQAREGMKVVDANGEELGKIEFVKMGDSAAATVDDRGDETAADAVVVAAPLGGAGSTAGAGIVGGLGGVFGGGAEPDIEEPMRSELLRDGFIKVDGKGWFDTDHYARADQIAAVTGDTVRLAVGRDLLPTS